MLPEEEFTRANMGLAREIEIYYLKYRGFDNYKL